MNWKELTSIEQFADIIAESQQRPVAVFKHSTRCSISLMAKRGLDADWAGHEDTITPYFLDLLQHRDVSNHIAETLGVRHESPQLILIQKGKAVYHAAHASVDYGDMAKAHS